MHAELFKPPCTHVYMLGITNQVFGIATVPWRRLRIFVRIPSFNFKNVPILWHKEAETVFCHDLAAEVGQDDLFQYSHWFWMLTFWQCTPHSDEAASYFKAVQLCPLVSSASIHWVRYRFVWILVLSCHASVYGSRICTTDPTREDPG